MADFDGDAYKARLASLSDVSPDAITLAMEPASVRVSAIIALATDTEAAAVVGLLEPLAADTAAASAALGAEVVSASEPTVTQVTAVPPAPPPSVDAPAMFAGVAASLELWKGEDYALVAFMLILLLGCGCGCGYCCRRRLQPASPAEPRSKADRPPKSHKTGSTVSATLHRAASKACADPLATIKVRPHLPPRARHHTHSSPCRHLQQPRRGWPCRRPRRRSSSYLTAPAPL